MYRVAIIVNYQTLMNWNGAYCTMILKVQLNFVSYGDFVLFWELLIATFELGLSQPFQLNVPSLNPNWSVDYFRNQIFQYWNLFVGVIRLTLIGCVSQAFTSNIVKAKLDTGILVNTLSDYILALLILIVCTYRVSINVIH